MHYLLAKEVDKNKKVYGELVKAELAEWAREWYGAEAASISVDVEIHNYLAYNDEFYSQGIDDMNYVVEVRDEKGEQLMFSSLPEYEDSEYEGDFWFYSPHEAFCSYQVGERDNACLMLHQLTDIIGILPVEVAFDVQPEFV